MTTYTKATNFAVKDALVTGNPLKTLKGVELDDEFNAIAVASATKANIAAPTFTGIPAAPTATAGDNTTQLATTAFVTAAVGGVDHTTYLLKSGGALTGALTTNSTFDGVDIATRDAILTSTTTTAGAALPKAGGALSGAVTTNSTFDGRDVATDGTKLDTIVIGTTVGYQNVPQNSKSAAYTLVLADAGNHILHPAADTTARTFTIPANASVAYPIGSALSFINETAEVVTIAITSDTMILSSSGLTGSRSLAQYGSATAIKITATKWYISGSGLT